MLEHLSPYVVGPVVSVLTTIAMQLLIVFFIRTKPHHVAQFLYNIWCLLKFVCLKVGKFPYTVYTFGAVVVSSFPLKRECYWCGQKRLLTGSCSCRVRLQAGHSPAEHLFSPLTQSSGDCAQYAQFVATEYRLGDSHPFHKNNLDWERDVWRYWVKQQAAHRNAMEQRIVAAVVADLRALRKGKLSQADMAYNLTLIINDAIVAEVKRQGDRLLKH